VLLNTPPLAYKSLQPPNSTAPGSRQTGKRGGKGLTCNEGFHREEITKKVKYLSTGMLPPGMSRSGFCGREGGSRK